MKQLNAHFQREFQFEMDRFQLDKRVANLICDMDFLVQDNPDKSQTKFNRLVKRSNKHLVLITYELR